ncbi:MAG: hypothetical protein RL326_1351, partial [Pseudomonadota bacterium]
MKRFLFVLLAAVATMSPQRAICETMTAVCEEPKGFTVAFKDDQFNSSPDQIKGGSLSYSWD